MKNYELLHPGEMQMGFKIFCPYNWILKCFESRFATIVATGGHVKFVPAVQIFQKTTHFLAKFTYKYKIYTQQVVFYIETVEILHTQFNSNKTGSQFFI